MPYKQQNRRCNRYDCTAFSYLGSTQQINLSTDTLSDVSNLSEQVPTSL